jgi:hypothetical protein
MVIKLITGSLSAWLMESKASLWLPVKHIGPPLPVKAFHIERTVNSSDRVHGA